MPALRHCLIAGAMAAALLSGCARDEGPEARLRAVVAEAEAAGEARSPRAVLRLLAPDFRAGDGADAATLERYLRGWFLAHPSVHLLTRIERVELLAEDLAEMDVTVAMLGSEADASFDLAADVYLVELTLAREGDDWRVTRADWKPARP
jgi:hypothetical protein